MERTSHPMFSFEHFQKSWFFNLDPLKVHVSGSCHRESAVLSLTLPDHAASLQFTFKKVQRMPPSGDFQVQETQKQTNFNHKAQFVFSSQEKNQFYVIKLTSSLSPRPVCLGCASKTEKKRKDRWHDPTVSEFVLLLLSLPSSDETYLGSVSHGKLFAASYGRSFRCKSTNLLRTSSEMSIKLVFLQMQAFGVPGGHYGEGANTSICFICNCVCSFFFFFNLLPLFQWTSVWPIIIRGSSPSSFGLWRLAFWWLLSWLSYCWKKIARVATNVSELCLEPFPIIWCFDVVAQ